MKALLIAIIAVSFSAQAKDLAKLTDKVSGKVVTFNDASVVTVETKNQAWTKDFSGTSSAKSIVNLVGKLTDAEVVTIRNQIRCQHVTVPASNYKLEILVNNQFKILFADRDCMYSSTTRPTHRQDQDNADSLANILGKLEASTINSGMVVTPANPDDQVYYCGSLKKVVGEQPAQIPENVVHFSVIVENGKVYLARDTTLRKQTREEMTKVKDVGNEFVSVVIFELGDIQAKFETAGDVVSERQTQVSIDTKNGNYHSDCSSR
jgi:hypothetical protein